MTFQESDLTFDFSDADWEIIRYDTHRFYKTLSGAGLKGVDFLGIYRKEQIVFFEVKHFRSPQLTKNTSYAVLDDPNTFTNRITRKLKDTIKAIRVIIQYLERKRWYRLYLSYHQFIPSFFIKNKDWYFWHRLHQLAQHKELLTYVLWLEIRKKQIDTTNKKLIPTLTKALENNLATIVGDVKISNRSNPVFIESLSVK